MRHTACASRAWRCSGPGPRRASSTAACRFCFRPDALSKKNDFSSRPFAHFFFRKKPKLQTIFVELLHDAPLFRRFEARFGKFSIWSTERGAERGQRNVSEGRNRGPLTESSPSKRLDALDRKIFSKTGPPRLGVQRRAGLRLVEAVVAQEHGGQGRGGEGEGGLSRRRALSLRGEERSDDGGDRLFLFSTSTERKKRKQKNAPPTAAAVSPPRLLGETNTAAVALTSLFVI